MQARTQFTPQRWQRLQELFERAVALDPQARSRLLLEECGEDTVLREQVVSLLLASAEDGQEVEDKYEQAIALSLRASAAPPGTIIERYRVERVLGTGGMGTVYLADRADEQFQHTVALKLVSPGILHPGTAGRFRSERQILARLNHPNIARLLDGGHTEDGTPYLVMEYVEGVRIDEYCARHRLAIPARLRLMQQVCAAVEYAHQNLIVHRDLKPSNILVTGEGVPKLLDFGVAKLLDPQSADPELTRVRDRALTPEFASPEQLRGQTIGTVSDVYSLGRLLYELLSGRRPYGEEQHTLDELERLICDQDLLAPSVRAGSTAPEGFPEHSSLARELAGDLDNIVLKAMHRDPARRYSSAAALIQDIQNYLDRRPVLARPDTVSYRLGKFVRRNAWATASTLAVAVLIAGLTVYYTSRLTAERDTAQREKQTADSVAAFMVNAFRLANPNESAGKNVTVRQVLEAATARIGRDLTGQPRLRLTLMRNMGLAYAGLGLWREARALLETTVAQERSAFGNRQIELARALEILGNIQDELHQFDAADAAFREAWSIRTALKRDQDAEAALLLNAIATNYRFEQRYAQALEYHRRAEAHARALRPPDPKVLGQVLLGYGMTYLEADDYSDAERYTREAMPLVDGVVYIGNDMYADALATLGTAVRRQYRLDEAERIHRDLLKREIGRLGPDHLLVARAWNNLATVLRAKGDYPQGEAALLEARRIFRLIGADLAINYHNLGTLYHEAGELTKALEELNTAVDLKRKATGPRSPQTVSTLLEKTDVLRDLGRLAQARAVLDEAQSIAGEKFDHNDRRHAFVLVSKGQLELASGQYPDAERDLRSAVHTLQAQEDPGRLADAMASLAEVLVDEGKVAEARPILVDMLALRRKILPASHWAIADAQSRLGEALVLTGDVARGRELETRGLEQLRAHRPAGDVVLLAAEKRAAIASAQVSQAGK